MKRVKLVAMAISLVGILAAGNALAASTTADVNVNATILATCVATTSSDITFAAIDPLTTTGVVDSATQPGAVRGLINVKCTDGTAITLSAPGTGTMSSVASGGSIVYTPVVPAGSLTPGFAGTDYNVDATIAQAQYQAAPAASDYTDTFTVTITY